jgi:hypothetical protein
MIEPATSLGFAWLPSKDAERSLFLSIDEVKTKALL